MIAGIKGGVRDGVVEDRSVRGDTRACRPVALVIREHPGTGEGQPAARRKFPRLSRDQPRALDDHLLLSLIPYASAVTVISTRAPAGSELTPTVVRPGGLVVKYSA